MARERDNVRRDMAGVGPDPSLTGRLHRLSDIKGFKIASGEPDIRGWDVRTLSGSEVGEVDDLLIDPQRGEVVMLDVDLKDSKEHVSVPIRGVQLDRDRRCVIVDSGDINSARNAVMGDAAPRGDIRANDRSEDDRLLDENASREVRYGVMREGDMTEEVIERRPVIEEVVVRRRVIDPNE